jgi:HAD superfamily hydrolase (TIGR01509 family)
LTRYDAVFFDFDGVLIDSEHVHQECWAEVLAPLGFQLDWDTYSEHYLGVDDRVMLASLCGPASDAAWALYPSKKRLFEERMRVPGAIRAEVVELVADLSVKVAVVTSSARSEVEPILDRAGLLPHIDTTVYGEDVHQHKPHPEPYLLAAARLGAVRPLVVEDSPAGLASARAAGFDPVHVRCQADMCRLVRLHLDHGA